MASLLETRNALSTVGSFASDGRLGNKEARRTPQIMACTHSKIRSHFQLTAVRRVLSPWHTPALVPILRSTPLVTDDNADRTITACLFHGCILI